MLLLEHCCLRGVFGARVTVLQHASSGLCTHQHGGGLSPWVREYGFGDGLVGVSVCAGVQDAGELLL